MAISKNVVVNTSGTNLAGTASNGTNTNTFFTAAGVPYSSGSTYISSQPKVVGGTALTKFAASAGLGALNSLSLGYAAGVTPTGPVSYRGANNGISCAFISGALHGFKAAASGGYCAFTGVTGPAVIVGTKLYVGPSGTGQVAIGNNMPANAVYGIHTVTAANALDIVTDRKDIPDAAANTTKVTMQAINTSYSFATLTKGAYVGYNLTNKLAGVYSTVLRAPANDPSKNGVNIHRSINKLEAVRTTKFLTALRAGSYNRFTGKWITAPTVSNDTSATAAGGNLTNDDAATINPRTGVAGDIIIKTGRPKPWAPDWDGVPTYSKKTD